MIAFRTSPGGGFGKGASCKRRQSRPAIASMCDDSAAKGPAAGRCAAHIVPEHLGASRRRLKQSERETDRGRLPRSVQPKKTEDDPPRNLQCELVDRTNSAELLAELYRAYGGCWHAVFLGLVS